MTIPASPHGLTRKSVGASGLSVLGVSASAPMTVLAGGVIATFATAGLLGVPLAFVLLTIPLLLVSIGLVAMSRDMAHAGAFYAFLARGLGRTCGLAGGRRRIGRIQRYPDLSLWSVRRNGSRNSWWHLVGMGCRGLGHRNPARTPTY